MLWASLVRNLEWLVEQLPYRRVQAGRMALWVRCRNGRAGEGRATLEVPTDRFDMLLNTYRPCLRQAWVPRVLAARMHLFAEDLGPHAPREPDLFGDLEAGDAATALKWAVIDRHGRFALHRAVALPLGPIYADRANGYDICDTQQDVFLATGRGDERNAFCIWGNAVLSRRTTALTPARHSPMKLDSLRDLLVEQLQDLYDAEQRLTKALPKMEKAASSPELKAAFRKHLAETEGQVERLEQVFEQLGEKAKKKTCKAIQGLIEEGEETIKEEAEPEVRDAALIAAAQRVEHYEMAGYGTVRSYAKLLKETASVKLLEKTLAEEKATDEALTKLAESVINVEAA